RARAAADDIEPTADQQAAVDRDRPHRRMREDEAGTREPELSGDRLEVVAVRTEAVQPDHGRLGLRRAALDRLENRRIHIRTPRLPVSRRSRSQTRGSCTFAHIGYYMRNFIQPRSS